MLTKSGVVISRMAIVLLLLSGGMGVIYRFITMSVTNSSAVKAYPDPPQPVVPEAYPMYSEYPTPEVNYQIPTGVLNNHFFLPLIIKNSNPKKGLAWGSYETSYDANYRQLQVGWFHAYRYWGVQVPNVPPLPEQIGLEYVQAWGCINFPYEHVVSLLGSDFSGYLLWLNEPDTGYPDQCIVLHDVSLAAKHYISTTHYLPDANLVGPRVFAEDQGSLARAINWLGNWRQRVYDLTCGNVSTYTNPFPDVPCGYPDVTGYALHTYSQAVPDDTLNGNIRLVNDFHDQMVVWGNGSKELWIDEFGYCHNPNNTPSQKTTDYVEALEVLPFVTRYAYWSIQTPGSGYPFSDDAENQQNVPNACLNTYLFSWDANIESWVINETGEAYGNVANP